MRPLWIALTVGFIFVNTAIAAEKVSDSVAPAVTSADRAKKTFAAAQAEFNADSSNAALALQFGQAAFDWAEFATDNAQREAIALEGIAACRKAISLQPKSAGGHYYLAMNLGQLARTKTLGALKLVDEMETEFHAARQLDERFDFAGPDRNLGLLYSEAPGWPTSIGSRSKARHHMQRAIVLHPDYPENHLNLLEAYLKWSDKNGIQHEYKAVTELWPTAQKEFSGTKWELSWLDWEKRWKKIQSKFPDSGKNTESPRGKK